MMYGYGGFSWMWMLGMMFFMLVGTVGVVLLIVWLVRTVGGTQQHYYGPQGRPDDALEVARRRYASGEITKEQYDEIVATLRR